MLEAAHLRFRPIVMTSLAFIFGVMPLVLASGAGSAGQRAIGVGVVGGMLSATILGLLFVPIFFLLVRRVFKGRKAAQGASPVAGGAAGPGIAAARAQP